MHNVRNERPLDTADTQRRACARRTLTGGTLETDNHSRITYHTWQLAENNTELALTHELYYELTRSGAN